MVQYPLKFSVHSTGSSGIQNPWQTGVPGRDALPVAIPPEFEGPGGGYSPEDLYALALLNCFAATFKVIAERSQLAYESIEMEGTLLVDRDEKGVPWMKHFLLKAQLFGCPNRERAQKLLEKTSQSCLILNSVRTEKSFDFRVES